MNFNLEEANFWYYISLFPVAGALYLFNRSFRSRTVPLVYTAPYTAFSWSYFIVAPFCHFYFDVFVDDSIFSGIPARSIALWNVGNACGLLIALAGSTIQRYSRPRLRRPNKDINYGQLSLICSCTLVLSVAYGTYFIYIAPDFRLDEFGRVIIQGSIYQFMLIECAPMLFCWAASSYYISRGRPPNAALGLAFICMHFVLVILFCSSRGSRVAMLIQIIVAAQIFNFTVLRLRFVHFAIAAISFGSLLPIYSQYKYGGLDALQDYLSGRVNYSVIERYNDPVRFIVGDIGRADMQAPLLSALVEGGGFSLYNGETYASAVLQLLPRPIRPTQFRSKITLGAYAQQRLNPEYIGMYDKVTGEPISSRIYGLEGEALLNFGLIGIPFAFFVFGLLARRCFNYLRRRTSWSQVFFAPIFSLMPIYILFYDSDNIVFQMFTVWSIPSVIYAINMILSRGHIQISRAQLASNDN